MQNIDIRSAASRRWDFIVVGSSFASMFFSKGLPANASVLVVEKGSLVDHSTIIKQGLPPVAPYTQNNFSSHEKVWVEHSLFGGNSNCWWACTPRFHPNDFAISTLYGVGEDWPLDYAALEPFYVEAENIMQISGGGSDHILPRSAPFPFPPHNRSRFDARLQAHSRDWFAQPCARSNGGRRAPCCSNGVCDRCPIDSKFTISNGLSHFERSSVFRLTGCETRTIQIEGGEAKAVNVLNLAEKREYEVSGDVIALGANATGNVMILQRSDYDHPVLGRYLHEQTSLNVYLDTDMDGYLGGTSITGHGYAFYDGPHRSDYAAVMTELWNAPPTLRPERNKWLSRMHLKLIAEDLPQSCNTVTLGESDLPHYEWHGHSAYAQNGLDAALERLSSILPMKVDRIERSGLSATEAHIQGTHRMGTDPAKSVTDGRLHCHDVDNLLLLGSGSFPSCSAANPTLTLSALSLRAGRHFA